MLTPRFELAQTDTEVSVTVHAPYANIKDTEVYVEGTDFRFYSTPYYLRLTLPGEIVENDESSGSYDCDRGKFHLKFSKVNKGEHFENLDMITTLLAPPKENKNFLEPKVQVISNPAANDEDEEASNGDHVEDEAEKSTDWFYPQTASANNTVPDLLLNPPKYGFANRVSGALASFDGAWLREIIDLPAPDRVPIVDRTKLREAEETAAFSEDHYMADLVDEECVKPYANFAPECETLKPDEVVITDGEKDLLKELPNKDYLLDADETRIALYGMVDILFGACYNKRVTLGENTPESSWDVNKLSSTLSWFETFSSLEDVVRACVRRSLCYPFCRHWTLSMKTLEDVQKVLKLGKKYIVKVFCEIHEMFNDSCEPRYVLNQLYIKDYLIWLQKVPPALIESIVPTLEAITPKKGDMGFDLEELEVAAWSVQEDEGLVIENGIDQVIDKMGQTTLDDAKMKLWSVMQAADAKSGSESDSETDSSSSLASSSSSLASSSSSLASSSSSSSSGSSSSSSSSATSTSSSSCGTSATSGKIEKLDSDDSSDSGSA